MTTQLPAVGNHAHSTLDPFTQYHTEFSLNELLNIGLASARAVHVLEARPA